MNCIFAILKKQETLWKIDDWNCFTSYCTLYFMLFTMNGRKLLIYHFRSVVSQVYDQYVSIRISLIIAETAKHTSTLIWICDSLGFVIYSHLMIQKKKVKITWLCKGILTLLPYCRSLALTKKKKKYKSCTQPCIKNNKSTESTRFSQCILFMQNMGCAQMINLQINHLMGGVHPSLARQIREVLN